MAPTPHDPRRLDNDRAAKGSTEDKPAGSLPRASTPDRVVAAVVVAGLLTLLATILVVLLITGG